MSKPKIRFKRFTDDWEQRKLGELGEILTGSTPSTSNSAYYSEDGYLGLHQQILMNLQFQIHQEN